MGDSSFPARYITTLDMLNNTTTNLFQQYTNAQQASTALTSQKSKIEAEVVGLEAKLANVKMAADTYDREFQDRSAGRGQQGAFRKVGITTLQDWLLFLFFLSYSIIGLCVVIYAAMRSSNKIFTASLVAFGFAVIGIMMSAVIIIFI